MRKHLIIAAMVCALTPAAHAQDFDDDTTEETTDSWSDTTTTDTASSTSTAPAASAAGGPGNYQWAIQASFNGAADLGFVHGLYNLGGNYLDLAVDFNFTYDSPDGGDSSTDVAFRVLAGYRMYRAMTGRIHPYLEPYAFFGTSTVDGEPLEFGVGGAFGVDFLLFDQFTLGTSVNAELAYETADAGSTLTIDVLTAAINATFWW